MLKNQPDSDVALATPAKRQDRRIARTRQLLQQAFVEILGQKSFTAITVQDITEQANVNRGTFYAHFTDKYALFDAVYREQFQQHLESHLPAEPRWNRETLQVLIQTVMEYIGGVSRHCYMAGEVSALIERATHEVLTDLLLSWLRQEPETQEWRVPIETVAHVVSWTIFGAAMHSCQQSVLSTQQMARDVLVVMMEGMARLGPQPA